MHFKVEKIQNNDKANCGKQWEWQECLLMAGNKT